MSIKAKAIRPRGAGIVDGAPRKLLCEGLDRAQLGKDQGKDLGGT